MSYQQELYKVVEPIKKTTITRLNRGKKWKYGYNKEHDIVVISRSGEIGEIYEIQNFQIALPKENNVYVNKKKKWEQFEYPKELSRLKSIFDWKAYPEQNKEQWHDYIDEEFKRRDDGFWFNNKWEEYLHYWYSLHVSPME